MHYLFENRKRKCIFKGCGVARGGVLEMHIEKDDEPSIDKGPRSLL